MARRSWFRNARRVPDILGPRSAQARRAHQPTLGRLAAVIIGLATVAGGLVAVARLFASAPSIAPPVPDSDRQSRLPFTVSNNGWLSLYGVQLRCAVADITLGDGANIPTLGLAGASTVENIPSHNQREFVCPIDVQNVREAHVWLEASWKLHLLGVIPWQQHRDYVFELKRRADGRPSWQAGH